VSRFTKPNSVGAGGPEWDWSRELALIALPIIAGGGDKLRNYGTLKNKGDGIGVAGKWGQSNGIGIQTSAGDTGLDVVANNLLPANNLSVAIRYHKTDATLRNSGLFGLSTGGSGALMGVHGPWGDGRLIWDFGGGVEGTSRLTISGLSAADFTDAVWVFATGSRGMEIWKNGVLQASNAGNPSRTPDTEPWGIGEHGIGADAIHHSGLYVFKGQLNPGRIKQLSMDFHGRFRADDSGILLAPPTATISGSVVPTVTEALVQAGV